jgi:hypothetical protein
MPLKSSNKKNTGGGIGINKEIEFLKSKMK